MAHDRNFVNKSYERLQEEISVWANHLEKKGVSGIKNGNIDFNEFTKTPEGKLYNYISLSLPMTPSQPEKKRKVLEHPHCYFTHTKFGLEYYNNNPFTGLSIPENIQKAFLDIGITLSIDAILSATVQHYTSSPGGMMSLTRLSEPLHELCDTLYQGVYAIRENQDQTILNQFYALAKQHNLHPNKESIERLLN